MDNLFPELKKAFENFERAYNNSTASEEVAESLKESLKETLDQLDSIGYSKRELVYIFNVESLTYDRWKSGKGMKPHTFRDFQRVIGEILADRPLLPITASEAGYVSWRYVFEQRQMAAQRIWYVSEGHFLSEKSYELDSAFNNLFLERKEGQPFPRTLVYLYPAESEAERSLARWEEAIKRDKKVNSMTGTIIGIPVTNPAFPWFQPSVRTIIMERPNQQAGKPDIEAYLRTKVAKEAQVSICNAWGMVVNDQLLPWLSMEKELAVEWHKKCKCLFSELIDDLSNKQTKQQEPFAVFRLSKQDNARPATSVKPKASPSP